MHLFNWGVFAPFLAKLSAFAIALGLFVHFLASVATGTVYIPHETVQVTPPLTTIVATTSLPHTTVATSTKGTAIKKIPVTASLPIQKTTANKPATTPAPTGPQTLDTAAVSTSAQTTETLNTEARAALVNILCTTVSGGPYATISGSGVIVDSRGVILTNAHVAQYFLLKNYPFQNSISCVIRSGSPAQPLYTADVLYVPPAWVTANAVQLTATHPLGTGENDYAFLRITGTVSGSVSMPASFPTIPMSATPPEAGAPVLLASYPAQLLDGETVQKNLYSSSAVSTVQALYTFNDPQQVDLISVAGSVVSQTGSSGGALVGLGSGKLLGIIATETQGATTADRQLNAITLGFIDRSLSAQGKGGVVGFLNTDLAQAAADFAQTVAPDEIAQLTAALNKSSN